MLYSCSGSSENEGGDEIPKDIVHKIVAYQYDEQSGTSSGDCTGTSGLVYNGNKFEVAVKAKGEHDFNFTLESEVGYGLPIQEKLEGILYSGKRFTTEKDGIIYKFSVLMSKETGMVFHIIDFEESSIILRVGKRIN